MSLRHKARSAGLQVLCSLAWRNQVLTDDVEKTIEAVKDEFFPQQREDDFFRELIFGVIKKRGEMDPKIQEKAPKFKIDKIAAVDRVLLEMGAYELCYTDTPLQVVINEYIELAKEFGDEGTPRFVNGVLSALSELKAENNIDQNS